MQPAVKRFEINPGLPFSYSFTFNQGSALSQYPVDLTNATGQLTIQDNIGNPTLVLSSTPPVSGGTGIYFGGPSQTPSNGIIELLISSSDTSTITWQYGNYVLVLTTPEFGELPLMRGSFAVANFLPSALA